MERIAMLSSVLSQLLGRENADVHVIQNVLFKDAAPSCLLLLLDGPKACSLPWYNELPLGIKWFPWGLWLKGTSQNSSSTMARQQDF